jgi:hypothetical protein
MRVEGRDGAVKRKLGAFKIRIPKSEIRNKPEIGNSNLKGANQPVCCRRAADRILPSSRAGRTSAENRFCSRRELYIYYPVDSRVKRLMVSSLESHRAFLLSTLPVYRGQHFESGPNENEQDEYEN